MLKFSLGSPFPFGLPCPPWQLLCYGIISLFMQQMTNAICCLHIGPALPNGNRRRTAKNGCKDMIISNHLNNLLLPAERESLVPLFRVPFAVCTVRCENISLRKCLTSSTCCGMRKCPPTVCGAVLQRRGRSISCSDSGWLCCGFGYWLKFLHLRVGQCEAHR